LSKTFSRAALRGLRGVRRRDFYCSVCALHLYVPLCISFRLNDKCTTFSLLNQLDEPV
jgi:hypothetical protein